MAFRRKILATIVCSLPLSLSAQGTYNCSSLYGCEVIMWGPCTYSTICYGSAPEPNNSAINYYQCNGGGLTNAIPAVNMLNTKASPF